MKIMIGLPAWKRPNVLRVHTYYMTKYIIPELNKRGFNLARRTITKYRKKLNIASSRNR